MKPKHSHKPRLPTKHGIHPLAPSRNCSEFRTMQLGLCSKRRANVTPSRYCTSCSNDIQVAVLTYKVRVVLVAWVLVALPVVKVRMVRGLTPCSDLSPLQLFNHCICTFDFFLTFVSCLLTLTLHTVDVRLTCLINVTYLLTYLLTYWLKL